MSAAVLMTFYTGEKPDGRLVSRLHGSSGSQGFLACRLLPGSTGVGGNKQGRLAMEFYVNRGVLWQIGNSPVCSFIKS